MINFLKQSRIWYTTSAVLFLGSIGLIMTQGLNYGLDFTGGSLLELKFEQSITTDQVRTILADAETTINADTENPILLDNAVIHSSGTDRMLIRSQALNPTAHDAILSAFEADYPGVAEQRYETVGPIIGESMKKKSRLAILLAITFMIIYITFAFRRIPQKLNPWKFGTIAVVALIHDVAITTGFYVILSMLYGAEIDLLFVTAILTVFGFSVHDTIVVFDRMRENLKLHGHSKSLPEIANSALNQTLARSINTSLTTLVVILMIVVMGSASIRFFSLTLLFGIAIGTYSSIFIATPMLTSWLDRKK